MPILRCFFDEIVVDTIGGFRYNYEIVKIGFDRAFSLGE